MWRSSEVGDIEQALAFYGRLFDLELRGKSGDMAFIDLGDQFLALQKGRNQPAEESRHFGLVVDNKEAVRKALADAGIGMGLGHLAKNENAIKELSDRGMAPN